MFISFNVVTSIFLYYIFLMLLMILFMCYFNYLAMKKLINVITTEQNKYLQETIP